MKPGEVWSAHLPHVGSHEQSGIRPVIVVARVAKEIVIVIPCTSNLKALRFPFTQLLEPSKANGLTQTTVALVFHLRALDKRFLDRKLSSVSRKTFSEICQQARRLIG